MYRDILRCIGSAVVGISIKSYSAVLCMHRAGTINRICISSAVVGISI